MNEPVKQKVTDTSSESVTPDIFPGLAFRGKPVSKEEYMQHYEEYVERCSG